MPVLLNGARRRPVPDLLDVVRAVAETPHAWKPLLRFPDGADRWWTRLYADRRFDLWLLSWLPGHSTDLHDHGPSAAAFTVVHGVLNELRLDPSGALSEQVRHVGTATSLAAGVIHDVTGAGGGPAVSIHAYAPPLRELNFYTRDDQGRPRLDRTVPTREPEQELAS
jgi:predicted metal-dependent enzyme (double-stranded beta helix superfamily)